MNSSVESCLTGAHPRGGNSNRCAPELKTAGRTYNSLRRPAEELIGRRGSGGVEMLET